MWVYGSGFPKSHNVGLRIDKLNGAPDRGHRIAVANRCHPDGTLEPNGELLPAYEAKTEQGKQWQGWGTALKPAWEPIIVARKPLIGTVAENVLKYGTGAINVDGCRVIGETPSVDRRNNKAPGVSIGATGWTTPARPPAYNEQREGEKLGRWPANLIHDGSDEVLVGFPQSKSGDGKSGVNLINRHKNTTGAVNINCGESNNAIHFGDSGSAARFFYCAKASKQDRDEGCEGMRAREWKEQGFRDNESTHLSPRAGAGRTSLSHNFHPTVKPTALMRYLCKLVTPPNGMILDPFMGSGSTLKAAVAEGFRGIGIEMEAEYVEIAKERIKIELQQQLLPL